MKVYIIFLIDRVMATRDFLAIRNRLWDEEHLSYAASPELLPEDCRLQHLSEPKLDVDTTGDPPRHVQSTDNAVELSLAANVSQPR
jgi:hypothetical protein